MYCVSDVVGDFTASLGELFCCDAEVAESPQDTQLSSKQTCSVDVAITKNGRINSDCLVIKTLSVFELVWCHPLLLFGVKETGFL